MDFKHLNTFVTVATYLHFGYSAKALGIAQPHVSRLVRQLEEELGVRLFDRNKRNVQLTASGELFLSEAKSLLKNAELAKQRVRQSAQGTRGRLTISLVHSAMLGVLPVILKRFHQEFPDVTLSVLELSANREVSALDERLTDVVFTHPPVPNARAYARIDLGEEPLWVALPKRHPLANREHIDLGDLADEVWVMFPREDGADVYDRIISLCQRAGYSPKIVQQARAVQMRLGLVAAGFGVHLVQESWRTMPHPGVIYLPVHPTDSIGLSCYWRAFDPNPVLEQFIGVVKEYST